MNTLLIRYKDDPTEANYKIVDSKLNQFLNQDINQKLWPNLKQTNKRWLNWKILRLFRQYDRRDCAILLLSSIGAGIYAYVNNKETVLNISTFAGSLLLGKMLELQQFTNKQKQIYAQIQQDITEIKPHNLWMP